MVDARHRAAPSQVPKLSDGTLVPPLPQENVGFPKIPGVTYTGLKTTRYRFNLGPNFYQTFIPTINPPVITPPYEDNPANGPIYPSYVPKTDSDGNDIAGIRLPELTVPLATYTGWGLRSGVWANDGCEASGQYIPFKATAAERMAAGDPRPSVQERYPSFGCIAARSCARSMIWCATGSCFAMMPLTSLRACIRQGWMRECQPPKGTHLRRTGTGMPRQERLK